jgi:hypothetical protein
MRRTRMNPKRNANPTKGRGNTVPSASSCAKRNSRKAVLTFVQGIPMEVAIPGERKDGTFPAGLTDCSLAAVSLRAGGLNKPKDY